MTKALGNQTKLRPAEATLSMYDNTELQTRGMITATVRNPKTKEEFLMNFFVTRQGRIPILGSEAC